MIAKNKKNAAGAAPISYRHEASMQRDPAAVVVDIGVFSRFQSAIQNSIHYEQPIHLRCSGNQCVVAIAEVETIVIHQLNFAILGDDLTL